MSATTSTWPLSAAATQLLVDLREDGAPATTPQTISRLAVKELVLRGHLRIVEVKQRRLRGTVVIVELTGLDPSGLPPALELLAQSMPGTLQHPHELSSLIRAARRRRKTLFTVDLKTLSLEELRRHGYVEDRVKKVLGLWPSTFPAATDAGRAAAADARNGLLEAEQLGARAEHDEEGAFDLARRLAAMVLLVPAGLAVAADLSRRLRCRVGDGFVIADVGEGGFDLLSSFDLDSLIDSIGSDFGGALDSAFDAIGGSIDGGIDAGISSGGGDGSSGGDGGGGGCGGGGCGGGS